MTGRDSNRERSQSAGPVALGSCKCVQPPALQLHRKYFPEPKLERKEEHEQLGSSSTVHTPPAWLQPRLLAVILILSWAPDEALVAPLAPWALGLGKGLLEGVLLGVHLIVEEFGRQLCPVANLNLHGPKQKSPQW
jgi:hypothetical protein